MKNFRTRVERDRAANREVVIAEVLRTCSRRSTTSTGRRRTATWSRAARSRSSRRSCAPGSSGTACASIGEKGEPFDPKLHEAIVQVYSNDVTVNTVADVIEPGYALGERLLRPAKVAVSVPEP